MDKITIDSFLMDYEFPMDFKTARLVLTEWASLSTPMKWVKASERLPEETKLYIIRYRLDPTKPEVWSKSKLIEYFNSGYDYEWLDESSPDSQSLIDRAKTAEAEVYAVREGAEQWEQEYKDCRKILQDIIDAEASDWHRMSMANPLQLPLVLIVAKQFLSKYQHL